MQRGLWRGCNNGIDKLQERGRRRWTRTGKMMAMRWWRRRRSWKGYARAHSSPITDMNTVDTSIYDSFFPDCLPSTVLPSLTTISCINKYLVDLKVDHNLAQCGGLPKPSYDEHIFTRRPRARDTMDRVVRLMKFPSSSSDIDSIHPSSVVSEEYVFNRLTAIRFWREPKNPWKTQESPPCDIGHSI